MYANVPNQYREEQAFIREIWFQPDDLTARCVYADWLEERQDPRGKLIQNDLAIIELNQRESFDRNEHARLRLVRERLLQQVDPMWVCLIGLGEIELCPNTPQYAYDVLDIEPPEDVQFEYICPMRWERLQPSPDSPNMRLCNQCQRAVYYCFTTQVAREHAEMGQYAVIDPSARRIAGDMRNAGY